MTNKISVSPSLQDYLEAILNISQQNEKVRVTDLAEELEVAKSSVHQAVSQLKKAGLVAHEKYGPLVLTEKGEQIALKVKEKHDILVRFFEEVLGVSKEISHRDACLIEHSISSTSLDKLIDFMDNYTKEDV
ncbi:MAG TPA: metal-dependent transcriptional regulator [Clostridiaceae bacterium]|nr:metal-dependent transcriptional regulator [Clostridiaceae bacterium]